MLACCAAASTIRGSKLFWMKARIATSGECSKHLKSKCSGSCASPLGHWPSAIYRRARLARCRSKRSRRWTAPFARQPTNLLPSFDEQELPMTATVADNYYFDLYVNVTLVSSSSTRGLTKLYEFPALGTSTRTGNTPETRCCRFVTFEEAVVCSFSATFFAPCSLRARLLMLLPLRDRSPAVTSTVCETAPRLKAKLNGAGLLAS